MNGRVGATQGCGTVYLVIAVFSHRSISQLLHFNLSNRRAATMQTLLWL